VGERILEGLQEAVLWTQGKRGRSRTTVVRTAPDVDIRALRTRMGLSQAQFAARFGLPPATLKNWEQGRSRPDAPTRVLLAVIEKHPAVVESVLRQAG
jgi:putative transcriptional regulator